MNKKLIIIPIVVIPIIAISLLDDDNVDTSVVFHMTLADPSLYTNGIYTEKIFLDGGEYKFSFVPNGDSPNTLGISINGDTINFTENFRLVGTLHQTEISEYYTWDYDGQKTVTIPKQEVSITINPNGDINGPVSIYLKN